MKKSGLILAIVIILLVIVGIFFFTRTADTSQNNSNTNPQANSVLIKDFAFDPSILTISAGETVTWTNEDSAGHTLISDSGDELNSPSLSSDETYSHTFDTAGEYDYHCGIHPMMKGKIIVE